MDKLIIKEYFSIWDGEFEGWRVYDGDSIIFKFDNYCNIEKARKYIKKLNRIIK